MSKNESAVTPSLLVRSATAPPGLTIVAAYVAATVPVAATRASLGVAALHAAAAAILVGVVLSGRDDWFTRWLPLLLVPALYAELPTLMGQMPQYHDALVQGWEAALFGGQAARELAVAWPWRWLSEPLHAGYLSYYLIIYAPALALFVRRRPAAFNATVLVVMTTFVVSYAIFIAFPVEGPRYQWTPVAVPDGAVRRLTTWLLERGSSRGTAFPSSHAAVSMAATLAAWRYQPRVGAILAVATALLLVGAVYAGFHYGIDMLAGAALGMALAVPVLHWIGRSQATGDTKGGIAGGM